LDTSAGIMIDISPASYGNSPLGTDDGTGYDVNPATGEPYEPQFANRGDFTRLLSEFWADGPESETPPGHWNTLANDLSYDPSFERRLFGTGDQLDPLAWDVHLYLALNGALHDAAIVAWELKRNYVTARPITLIRTLGARGQSSDPDGPSFDPEGLPLVDGMIELITEESSAPGERHAHLQRYVGELAVFSWRGEPGDRENEVGGIAWIRAVEWIPYQRRTFVTPAFPGFVSGHSTFSRSAAEVLTQITGSPYFPGGLGGYTLDPGWLVFENGPTETVRLEWATYYDASDQAGQSRLWGGIHVRQDDYVGREVGADVGDRAVEAARTFFGN
ncbi:MAG: vanadium-dependent haloperoxidase, partial [Phycisphaerae bacterium]